MSCEFLSNADIEQFVAGELSTSRSVELEQHLSSCAICAARASAHRANLDALADKLRMLSDLSTSPADTHALPVAANLASETVTVNSPGDRHPASANPRLGNVRLLRQIGRGGMGVVWAGHDDMLDRDVAVKFMTNAVRKADDPEFRQFIEGARAAAAVRHPNLNSVLSVEIVNGTPALILDYVNGITLAQMLEIKHRLSVGETVALLKPICAALGALHANGVVHGDIKPSNILLDYEGGVYVTDFGLAWRSKVPGDPAGEPVINGGTPAYMAPELQVEDSSIRSDVYALGMMTFEMLTGKRPFTGSASEVLSAHKQAPMPLKWLEEFGVPVGLIQQIERATGKNPLFRHKTASHFIDSICEACVEAEVLPTARVPVPTPGNAVEQSSDGSSVRPFAAHDYYQSLSTLAGRRRESVAAETIACPSSSAPINRTNGECVQFVLPCVGCEYNLISLPYGGCCPECGVLIEQSLDDRRLLFADPEWLRAVLSGIRLMHWGRWGCWVQIVCFVFAFASASVAIASAHSSSSILWINVSAMMPMVILAVLTTVAVVISTRRGVERVLTYEHRHRFLVPAADEKLISLRAASRYNIGLRFLELILAVFVAVLFEFEWIVVVLWLSMAADLMMSLLLRSLTCGYLHWRSPCDRHSYTWLWGKLSVIMPGGVGVLVNVLFQDPSLFGSRWSVILVASLVGVVSLVFVLYTRSTLTLCAYGDLLQRVLQTRQTRFSLRLRSRGTDS